jgi:menaquinol-cytochrome c reductase iron-sulfur subunit
MTTPESPIDPGRRSFLVRAVTAIHAAIGGTLAFVLGGAVLAPSFNKREADWLKAASLDALRDNEPVPVTLRVTRQDGYAQVVDRKVVYLVKTGTSEVRALESTCTHLGCRTSYDRQKQRIVCPCHGGQFGVDGSVKDGPPPEPLRSLQARVDGTDVLVQV